MGMKGEAIWRIEPHCCAVCFGRILSRETEDSGQRLYRCADCGTEKQGALSRVICACGVKLNARSAGIRCEPNAQKTPEFPFEICARQT